MTITDTLTYSDVKSGKSIDINKFLLHHKTLEPIKRYVAPEDLERYTMEGSVAIKDIRHDNQTGLCALYSALHYLVYLDYRLLDMLECSHIVRRFLRKSALTVEDMNKVIAQLDERHIIAKEDFQTLFTCAHDPIYIVCAILTHFYSRRTIVELIDQAANSSDQIYFLYCYTCGPHLVIVYHNEENDVYTVYDDTQARACSFATLYNFLLQYGIGFQDDTILINANEIIKAAVVGDKQKLQKFDVQNLIKSLERKKDLFDPAIYDNVVKYLTTMYVTPNQQV